MSTHLATTHWQRGSAEAFTDQRYARRHAWHFDGGAVVPGSSAPSSVPLPYSDPAAVDPEEAFVAALSSCHLLWFLHLAAQDGWVVDDYRDEAAGAAPTPDQHAALHHRAHDECFIANSVACEVHCHPTIES